MKFPKIGNMAPAFTLKNQNNEKVSLRDFRGKRVLIYFYPRALTPGCTTQSCALRDIKKELERLNTIVIGISPDAVEKLKKFEEKKSLNFDLLSDEDHKTCEKYGVWGLKKFMGKEYMGLIRTSFLITEEGRLLHIFDKFKTKEHGDMVLDFLKNS